METFIEELDSKKVLSKDDIILLKQYISKKYINYTKEQKSDVLSKAIYQVLDKSVKGLDEHYIKLVKKIILKNTILKDGNPVLFSDIFKLCLSIEDKSNTFKQTLLKWINSHIDNKISIDDLETYYSSIPSISLNAEVTTEMDKNISHNYVPSKIDVISKQTNFKINLKSIGICTYLSVLFLFFLTICLTVSSITLEKQGQISNLSPQIAIIKNKTPESNIIVNFKYKDINRLELKTFLNLHNSLLAEEPYFSTIISVSKQYGLNPLILFAITGQEENFVSKEDPNSKKIVNNPYNVYHSWEEYNTNINDSTKIASLTIINLSKDRPKNEEPFHWLNRSYAEDPNWSKGVKIFYETLEENDSKTN